jgi:hypothetical protein
VALLEDRLFVELAKVEDG